MSFRTPLKSSKVERLTSSSQRGLMAEQSTASTIKKQHSLNNTEENVKKNRSVTFLNNDRKIAQRYDKMETLTKYSDHTNKQIIYPQHIMYENENVKIGDTIQDILSNATQTKQQIYQYSIERQKYNNHNQNYNNNYNHNDNYKNNNHNHRERIHCANDTACSKHINHSPIITQQSSQKTQRNQLEEYNYQQTQTIKAQNQLRNSSNSTKRNDNIKTPEKIQKKNSINSEEDNISEKEILYNLQNAARGISSKTFLKIQACIKPHPVLTNYCLSLIFLYKDYLQISDNKFKKLETNWRELQDVFTHHAPLFSALDNVEQIIKQGRIGEHNIKKSVEYINNIDFLIDKIKGTSLYCDIINPIDTFLKCCKRVIRLYNNTYDSQKQHKEQQNTQREGNMIQSFNRFDQIMKIKLKKPDIQQRVYSDQMRRNTYGDVNQYNNQDSSDLEDGFGSDLNLSPIQHQNQIYKEQYPQRNLQHQQDQKLIYDQCANRRQSESHLNDNIILSAQDQYFVTKPLDQLQMDYFKKIKKYLKRMEEIEKIKNGIWDI